jgi:chromosome segregation ATPase
MTVQGEAVHASFRADEEAQMQRMVQAELISTKEHLRQLVIENRRLAARLADLEFRLDESVLERTTFEEFQSAPQATHSVPTQPNFFAVLTALERSENSITAEISTVEQKLSELSHYHNKLIQMNKDYEKKLDLKQNFLTELRDKTRSLRDSNILLATEAADRESVHAALLQSISAMQADLVKAAPVAAWSEQRVTELRTELLQARELLEIRKRERVDVVKKLASNERGADARKKKVEADISRASSIRGWEGQRKKLIVSLKNVTHQLSTCMASLDAAEGRVARLAQQIRDLLRDEDPGDGSGKLARQIVRSEIEFLQMSGQSNGDLEIELAFEAELKQRLAAVTQAKKDLEGHRRAVLKDLEVELAGSSGRGYLELLQGHLNTLKSTAAGRAK